MHLCRYTIIALTQAPSSLTMLYWSQSMNTDNTTLEELLLNLLQVTSHSFLTHIFIPPQYSLIIVLLH